MLSIGGAYYRTLCNECKQEFMGHKILWEITIGNTLVCLCPECLKNLKSLLNDIDDTKTKW
jgi:NAD-dependent SIR2 family protein deacetylase